MAEPMRLDTAIEQIGDTSTPEAESLERRLGKSLMEAMMERFVEQAKQTVAGQSDDWIPRVANAAMGLQALKQVFGGGEDRASARSDDSALATVMRAMFESQAKITETLMNAQAKGEERFLTLVQALNEKFDRVVQEIRTAQGQEGDQFKQLAYAALMEKIQSNPLQGYLELRKSLREEWEAEQQGKVIDFEAWKAREQFALEREKIREAREERQAQQAYQMKIVEGFAEALRGTPSGSAPLAPGTPGPVPGTVPPGLVRYRCHQCGATFVMQPVERGVCPRCQTPFTAAPAPGLPATGSPPPGPAAPAGAAPSGGASSAPPPAADQPAGSDLWGDQAVLW